MDAGYLDRLISEDGWTLPASQTTKEEDSEIPSP